MTFKAPTIPGRSEFLRRFLEAVFPNEEKNCSAYAYTQACNKATYDLGIKNDFEEVFVEENSNFFRLMYELNNNYSAIFGKKSSLLSETVTVPVKDEKGDLVRDNNGKPLTREIGKYAYYNEELTTYCSTDNASLRNWLKAENDSNSIIKSMETALFFTYLLLSRNECKDQVIPFFEYCLDCLGVADIDESVKDKLFDFNWNELAGKDLINSVEFTRLGNRAIILLGTAAMTVIGLFGHADDVEEKTKSFYNIFEDMMKEEIYASEALDAAECELFNKLKYFEPRSIQSSSTYYPQDFFVMPRFLKGEFTVESPMAEIKNAHTSKRLMIMAKTGLGKTAFVQMVSLCMLKDKYGRTVQSAEKLDEFANKLNVPEDMYVIHIPARMFSYCYTQERYKAWTTDFVQLFLNYMWRLAARYNCYSHQDTKNLFDEEEKSTYDFEVRATVTEYIKTLAKKGKLLLILDSFDEISSGAMRDDYLRTLAAFYDNYCQYYEAGEVGAHVIISSREMSKETMHEIENAVTLDNNQDLYTIATLNEEQRRELITNWANHGNRGIVVKDMLDMIETNHYYRDYAVNPYMLSVVCSFPGLEVGSITQRYIKTLVDRMLKNSRTRADVVQDVLNGIEEILQDVAGTIVEAGETYFSKDFIRDKYFREKLKASELDEEEVRNYIETLHEIFVTEVGLIVPADGRDSDYQFINSQIRYELAAKGMQSALADDKKTPAYREKIFPGIESLDEYVGLMVPLLCSIGTSDVRLAELLVYDLVMHEVDSNETDCTLNSAMTDLLLNRYGTSIITAGAPGRIHKMYVKRAQKALLTRLLSSANFKPTDEEKELIKESAAYRDNEAWLADSVKKILD